MLNSFCSDERASTSILFGAMAIVLFAFIGGAVDYARWHHAFGRTTAAMDAALLVAGRTMQTEANAEDKAIAAATTYFQEQIKSRFPVDSPSASFSLSPDGMTIEGKATGRIKTPFMGLVNVESLPVNVEAKASLAVGGSNSSALEISLMLDVTGSMCDDGNGPCKTGSKIDALKTAAKDLIDIIVRPGSGRNDVRVALVPFETLVRVANNSTNDIASKMKTLTNLDDKWNGWFNICQSYSGSGGSSSEVGGSWSCNQFASTHFDNWHIMPCVTDRTGPQEFTDAAPSPNAWLNAHDGGRFPLSWDSSDTPITAGNGLGQQQTDPAIHWNYADNIGDWCNDVASENIVVPLSSDNAMLKQHIDDLSAYGATAGALGTAWSWYMISPDWQSIWPSASQPGPYSDLTALNTNGSPKLRKIAVLMTDGEYNTFRSWKDQPIDQVSDRARQICANMKAVGIEIFTVGFDLDKLPADKKTEAYNTLRECAKTPDDMGTNISRFYDAVDPVRLQQSFRDIALKLSELYISK